MLGASANGRKAWLPLSDGISPTQGADCKGPTAIIKSVSKMSNDNMNIGMVHNFKLLPGLLDTPEGEQGLITLLAPPASWVTAKCSSTTLITKPCWRPSSIPATTVTW